MSRHQAYRNYDYENDLDEFDGGEDEYGGEEEEALSAEDKEQMEAGTAEIRSILGPQASKVTTAQIQEALWHYYYDVDKSVTYLITKFIDPPAPKAAKSAPVKNKEPAVMMNSRSSNRPSFAGFFHDMPWLNTPQDRQATFVEPLRPRGGLLGGSSAQPKMSKLQLLAAERKRKAEEQKTKSASGPKGPVQQTTQNLSKLSLGSKSQEVPVSEPTSTASSSNEAHATTPTPAGLLKRKTSDLAQLDGPPTKAASPRSEDVHMEEDLQSAPAEPSAFAQCLVGSSPPAHAPERRYALPWMKYISQSSLLDAFSGPSPDDVVLSAQAKASNKKLANTTKKKGGDDKVDQTADGIKAIKLDDTPLPKSKNLDVLGEYEKSKSKKSASFVVVGHVDAGKSTLMGRLLLDLNVVDQRTIERYRKEAEQMGKSSFALAWVLDQRVEERSRGVTIDIATNRFETETTSFTILDAPGHRDFVPNMIAGASQADFAILVVDASTGSFESGLKGQTREHALLIRSMGVSRVIVAVNKLDTVGWSQERFDEITHQVSGFMSTTGFQLKNISFVPVSGLNGDNLVNRSVDPASGWYSGDTLMQELEKSEPLTRALDKPLRLTISEVFRTAQSPLTISGRIDAGSLQAGDALLVQPSGEKAYVKSLELDSEPVDWAVAGQNVVIHLTNIDPIHVRVGDIVCDPKSPVNAIDTFTIKALAFDFLMPMQVDVHRGRMWAPGQIVEMSAILDKVKGTVIKKKPRVVKAGSVARVVVKMSDKVPLEAGQRIVLRSNGVTIAAGLLE
ncbi:Hsp70 suppressor, GTPase facilitates ribosomal subunit dissociation [Neopestalotiopsis sp. 37M]|nr:Hsp70 suppressor, GTPase facilitates ribosomal subunit dissociation [Neopestalotiopsis sp. 37M]